MPKYILIFALSLFPVGCAHRGMGTHFDQRSPEAVVRAYIDADLFGATLSTKAYETAHLSEIIVPTEYVSPGWDTVSIVESAEILAEKTTIGQDKLCKVVVQYNTLGEVAEKLDLHPNVERYIFKTQRIDDQWFLMDPVDLRPHVSVSALITHIQGLLSHESERSDLKATLSTLQSLPEK